MNREKRIYRVTIAGSAVNTILMLFKFVAGILSGSAAMIADAVHSLSDFLSDIVLLIFVKMGAKPRDDDHDYGHGKYETMATVLIGVALLAVGLMIFYNSTTAIVRYFRGESVPMPGAIAFWAALVSIALKEWTFRFTIRVGRELESQAVIANAWHHRSDALSSIGTALGIGGALVLGPNWAVLDPIAAVLVSTLIIGTAGELISDATGDLLERSLPKHVEDNIVAIAEAEEGVSEIHNLRTRRIGSHFAIEMHIRVDGRTTVNEAHEHATAIEQRLREQFGPETHISIHVEPLKKLE